jgi:hypothetical protein
LYCHPVDKEVVLELTPVASLVLRRLAIDEVFGGYYLGYYFHFLCTSKIRNTKGKENSSTP